MAKRKREYFSEEHRAQWKTRTGFIFAAIGSAVGLGNIWRFSYLAYEHGGGAFLIPYFAALFIVGIPLMILEFGIGHRERGSAPKSFHSISGRFEWLGWWPVIFVMFGIVVYYSVVISWCVNYLFYSFNLAWGADPNSFFFNDFLQLSSGPGDITGFSRPILSGLLLVWFLNWLIVYAGVEKGIERATKILMPALFLMIIALAIWALTLPNAAEGVKQYLRPDFSALGDTGVWMAAFSQIFFTLSLGFGIMIAYASYLPRKTDLAGNAYVISIGNCIFSLIAGLAVFGTLGYMAGVRGVGVGEVVDQSVGLAFVAYPQAISIIPAFPHIFGVLFFGILVFAGLSSSISIVEAFASSVMDKFHYSRKSVVSVLCLAGFLGGIIFTTGAGLHWLDITDHFLTNYGLTVVAILECVVAAWLIKTSRMRKYINSVSTLKTGKWWEYSIGFITPAILAYFFITGLYGEIISPYGGYPIRWLLLIGYGWLIITLLAAVAVSKIRWRHEKNEV